MDAGRCGTGYTRGRQEQCEGTGRGDKSATCRNPWQCEDGARGQYIIVVPERNAVIAITSDVEDLQGELNLVWERILPIF